MTEVNLNCGGLVDELIRQIPPNEAAQTVAEWAQLLTNASIRGLVTLSDMTFDLIASQPTTADYLNESRIQNQAIRSVLLRMHEHAEASLSGIRPHGFVERHVEQPQQSDTNQN